MALPIVWRSTGTWLQLASLALFCLTGMAILQGLSLLPARRLGLAGDQSEEAPASSAGPGEELDLAFSVLRQQPTTDRTKEKLYELAMEHGINIEHACGGVCACSTCHVHVEKGMNSLTEATEAEEDRVEEAPGLSRHSRLSCQCEITGDGPIVVRVPAWNRNAVKEVPH